MSLLALLPVAAVVPEDSGGPYVIAAYVVFLVITVSYVAIMARRLTNLSRKADEIQARLDRRDAEAAASAGGSSVATSGEPVAERPEEVAR